MTACTHRHRTQCPDCWDRSRATSTEILTDRKVERMLARRADARLQIIAINRRDAEPAS